MEFFIGHIQYFVVLVLRVCELFTASADLFLLSIDHCQVCILCRLLKNLIITLLSSGEWFLNV